MLIVLKRKNDVPLIKELTHLLQDKFGCPSHIIGTNKRVLAVTGDTSTIDINLIKGFDGVKSVDRVDRPYKLATREKKDRTLIEVSKGCVIGDPKSVVMIAGPCSIDSPDALDEAAAMAQGLSLIHI